MNRCSEKKQKIKNKIKQNKSAWYVSGICTGRQQQTDKLSFGQPKIINFSKTDFQGTLHRHSNGVIVLYLQTVANIYSNSDLCYNKNES